MKKLLLLSFVFAATFNCNAQWVSGGTRLSFTPDNHHRPFVSAAPNGAYYVVWQATGTTSSVLSKIKIAGYDSNGTLRSGWKLSGDTTTHDTGNYYGAQLITAEDGGVIVAWYGYIAGSNRSHIFAQRYTAAGTALWNSGNPVQVSTGTKFIDEYPMLVNDKYDGFFVSWTRFDSTIAPSSADVLLQHIDSTGKPASGWNANGTGVATTSGIREFYPKLAFTPDQSSVYVLYASGLIGNTSLILKKYNALTGALAGGWSASGVNISPGPNVYPEINHDMALYADNSNNAVAIWVEARVTGNGEIYMQQVNQTGTVLLTSGGKFLFGDVSGSANGIDYVEVIQEADKDLLIAYNNLFTFNDVAALKVKPNGIILWNDSLITSGGKSAYPYPASDGKKGMFLFYVNTSTTPEKLYAIGLDSLGAMYKGAAWALPGPGFGTNNNYDGFNPNYDQNAIGTNKGEAVVAWNRKVGSFYNIFACNLLSNGSTCITPTGINEVPIKTTGYALYPNPAKDNISITGAYEGAKLISIYNIVGQEVSTVEKQGKKIIINTSAFTAGMYFVTIKEIATGNSYTLKVVKN